MTQILRLLGEGSACDLVHILAVGNRGLLTCLPIALFFAEDGLDFLIEVLTSMTHEENLKGLFDGDLTLEVLVVHEEGDKVVELAGLEVLSVANAALVHRFKFGLGDETVKVIIDLPDDEIDIGACWSASEELKGACNVHGADLVQIVSLSSVTRAQEVEHTVQLLLLNGLDLNSLEDFSGACLQFFHLYDFSFNYD